MEGLLRNATGDLKLIDSAVEAAVRHFTKSGLMLASEDDLRNEGWEAALRAVRGFKPEKGTPLPTYIYVAARIHIGNWITSTLAAVHVPKGRPWGRNYQNRTDLGDVVLESCDTPEAVAEELDRENLRRRVREAVRRATQTMTEEEQKIVELRWGFDQGEERRPAEVAREVGVTVQRVYFVTSAVMRALRDDPEVPKIKKAM